MKKVLVCKAPLLLLVLLLLVASHASVVARPFALGGGGGKSRAESSFAFLELALRQALREIACEELTASELEGQFIRNSTVSRNVKALLKHIDLPVDRDDLPALCGGSNGDGSGCGGQSLHFLDFRDSGSDTACVASALPRLRLIESPVPVFPAYYMDWECGTGCVGEDQLVTNYELLQRTRTCCDGTADWVTTEAGSTLPLTVARTCTALNDRTT